MTQGFFRFFSPSTFSLLSSNVEPFKLTPHFLQNWLESSILCLAFWTCFHGNNSSFFILLNFLDFSLPISQGEDDFSVFYNIHLNVASEIGDLGTGPLLLSLLLVIFQPFSPCLLLDLWIKRLCPPASSAPATAAAAPAGCLCCGNRLQFLIGLNLRLRLCLCEPLAKQLIPICLICP